MVRGSRNLLVDGLRHEIVQGGHHWLLWSLRDQRPAKPLDCRWCGVDGPEQLLGLLAEALQVSPGRLLRLLTTTPRDAAAGPFDASRARTLETLRRRRGLTVTASARFVGVSRWSIRAWEDRRTVPPLWAIRRLATLYGVTAAEVAEVCGAALDVKLHPRTWRPGDFGEVLVTLRAWTGVTQRDVAERLGAGTATVRAWEAGRCRPRAASLRKLERLFGLPLSALDATVPAP